MTNRRGLAVYRPIDRRGVSEVIGTVLLLAMTVVVFSGIILFVNSLTGPGDETYVDLVPSLQRTDPNNGVIYITHAGGQALDASLTAILVQSNSTSFVLAVSDGLTPTNGKWVTGQRWTVPFLGNQLSQNATIQVTVIDQNTNQVVLLAVVQRGVGLGGTFPIIGTGTVIPNGFVYNDGADRFRIRVIAVDYDHDLPETGVSVNMSPLGCGIPSQTLRDTGFGVYESTNSSVLSSCVPVGTHMLTATATDLQGHVSSAKFAFKVVRNPAATPPPNSGTGPFGWYFSNEFQAYEIFNETEWDANRYFGNGTRSFIKGETVVIVIASQYIKNTELQNDFRLYGSSALPPTPVVYSNAPYNKPVTSSSIPSSTDAFSFEEFVGGFFVFIIRFTTDSSSYGFDGGQLALGTYTVEMTLRADNVAPPKNRFATADNITITDSSGLPPAYPRLAFYNDSKFQNATNAFHFTQTAYVKIDVSSTDSTAIFGDVQIGDYVGGIQVWARPGSTPVSDWVQASSAEYAFAVDLSDPNVDGWIFATNAYGLKVTQLIDDDEQYTLSGQIIVTGPEWGLDTIIGIDEFTHPVHDGKTYAAFYANDQLWTRNVIEFYESLPSAKFPPWGGGAFLDVTFDDFDSDGDLDAVYGLEIGRVWLYRNSVGSGAKWERTELDFQSGVQILAVASGPLDKDNDPEVIAGTSGGELWLYMNDGEWTPTLVADLNSAINTLRIADVTNDSFKDIILGSEAGQVRVYVNDGLGAFGLVLTANYTMAGDIAVQGTVTGSYTDTQTSNNGYESIREVNGSGEAVTSYYAIGEFVPLYGLLESGSYANTVADDGSPYEVLAEEFYDGSGPNDLWMIRNSTAGSSPGHQYAIGNIPSLGASDYAQVTINAFLSEGSEPIEVRYKVGTGSASAVLGTFSEASETTKTFTLTGFTGGDLYIVLQDSDQSDSDSSTDAKQTKISVDLVRVDVTAVSGSTSRLEHKWQSSVIGSGGSAYRVFMEAHRTFNSDNDSYYIQWSTASSGPWADLFTVSKAADNDVAQTATLPVSVGGATLYFRVVDSNHTVNATTIDTVSIDHLFVRRYIPVPNFTNISVGTAVKDLDVGDINGDGLNDIVVAAGTNVIVYLGASWSSSRTLAAAFTVDEVKLGKIDSDTKLDIVAGGSTKLVYWLSGVWTRVQITDTSAAGYGNIVGMAVADVDSDYWDDIVVGTSTGRLLWFRHVRGESWSIQQQDYIESPVYALALGDVDRGVILDYANP